MKSMWLLNIALGVFNATMFGIGGNFPACLGWSVAAMFALNLYTQSE